MTLNALRLALARGAWSRKVRAVRAEVRAGDLVRVLRGGEAVPAMVLNVRRYAHGPTEVYVQADGERFAGWVSVEAILPLEVKP